MKKLVIRDDDSPLGHISLSWCCPSADGSPLESPRWGLLENESQLVAAQRELREKGHVFEVEDLRAGSGVEETPRLKLEDF